MKRKCPECRSIAYCKRTFGRYWRDKSGGGVGCEYPLDAITPKGCGVVEANKGIDDFLNMKIKEGKLKL